MVAKRQALQAVRADFQRRLHRDSDDLAATEGLREIEAEIRNAPRPREGVWAWQDRERRARKGR